VSSSTQQIILKSQSRQYFGSRSNAARCQGVNVMHSKQGQMPMPSLHNAFIKDALAGYGQRSESTESHRPR
jgi:hypothetical protein